MNNLIIAFCSFRPSQFPTFVNDFREKEYLISLQQLKRIVSKSFDILIMDNTVGSPENLCNKELESILKNEKILFLDRNIGNINKGLGELDMLRHALINKKLENYDKIVYFSARHFVTCPYFFEKVENLRKDALISNPDFVYLSNGQLLESAKEGLYNDMAFAMKCEIMKKYAAYGNFEEMSRIGIGSEQNLYNFIHEYKIDFEWIDWIGLIRNDWLRNGNPNDLNNFHIC